MPTIRDVAHRAGVSAATVSHTINGTRYVDPVTQERVRQAIVETGYRPNALARSLRRRETRTFGLIIPDITNPFFAEMARTIEDAGFAAGYSVVLCNSDRSAEKEAGYVDVLLAKQVDGIILASANAQPATVTQIQRAGVPVLLIPGELVDYDVDILMTDDLAAGRLAARHLLDLGHTHIACISGPRTTSASAGRVAGFEQTLADEGLRLVAVARGDFRAERGRDAMAELLDGGLSFTALFAANDLTAIGAMQTLHQRGVRIPEDLSIIGFDNMRLSELVVPSLTTIAHSLSDIGPRSIQMLQMRIAHPEAAVERVLLNATLVVRESTSAVRWSKSSHRWDESTERRVPA
ncbi:MAG: LacI family DNA-binding transcriptional regulator [Thermomicrobiales bacterium]